MGIMGSLVTLLPVLNILLDEADFKLFSVELKKN